jgi:hypothetical protein
MGKPRHAYTVTIIQPSKEVHCEHEKTGRKPNSTLPAIQGQGLLQKVRCCGDLEKIKGHQGLEREGGNGGLGQ